MRDVARIKARVLGLAVWFCYSRLRLQVRSFISSRFRSAPFHFFAAHSHSHSRTRSGVEMSISAFQFSPCLLLSCALRASASARRDLYYCQIYGGRDSRNEIQWSSLIRQVVRKKKGEYAAHICSVLVLA